MPSVTLNLPDAAAERIRVALIPYSADPDNPDTVKMYLIDCLKDFIRQHDVREAERVRQELDDDFGIT